MPWPIPSSKPHSKKLRPLLRAVADAFPQATVELWATNEHRIGLKPLLRRVWAPMGQRPTTVVQHRFAWHYLIGVVHPASGRTCFHLATTVSIPVFEVELAEFARQVGASSQKQIVLVRDRAGWHTSGKRRVPDHVHVLFLPRIRRNCSRPNTSWTLWPLTNAPLLNRPFASIKDLEEAQFAR